MKTINQFRSTSKFCITGSDLEEMIRVHKFCEKNNMRIVGIAITSPEDLTSWTVRAITKFGVEDFLIRIRGIDCVIEDSKMLVRNEAA